MILGIGHDLVDVGRIRDMLAKHGDRFIQRCFTDAEQSAAEAHRGKGGDEGVYASYAKRFAAKEACSKALGTGIAESVYLRDIGVENDGRGAPVLVVSGGARARLLEMTPDGYTPKLHISLSDEPPLAGAYVILEAIQE